MARRDSYGKCPVKWFIDDLGKKKWVCFQHLAPYRPRSEEVEQCWYSTCPGRSMFGYPLTEAEKQSCKTKQAIQVIKENEKTIQIEEPRSTKQCENYGCIELSRVRSKYCSKRCQKQKARRDYETRNPNRRKKKSNVERKETPVSPPQPISPPEMKVSV